MHLDTNPVFRKVIVPWYDSDRVCYMLLAFMLMVILLGGMGISVAFETPEYQQYLWVPLLLMVLGGWVTLSVSIRLIRRKASQ